MRAACSRVRDAYSRVRDARVWDVRDACSRVRDARDAYSRVTDAYSIKSGMLALEYGLLTQAIAKLFDRGGPRLM